MLRSNSMFVGAGALVSRKIFVIQFHHIRQTAFAIGLKARQMHPNHTTGKRMNGSIANCLITAKALGLPSIEAELLMLHVLGFGPADRSKLRTHGSEPLPPHLQIAYQTVCNRRLNHEPVAYITGHKEFYGMSLQVDNRVLDPRADTETLVEWVLEVLNTQFAPHVADLGTGSGAIALAVQHNRPDAHVLAVDASAAALTVARANALSLGLGVRFAQGVWLEPLHRHAETLEAFQGWQVICSNPPYIAEDDLHLHALRHEPLQALTSGVDGLDDIRHIVQHAPLHLCSGGWLMLEHGHDQASDVQTLLRARGFSEVQTRNDLAGIARCTGGVWSGNVNAG